MTGNGRICCIDIYIGSSRAHYGAYINVQSKTSQWSSTKLKNRMDCIFRGCGRRRSLIVNRHKINELEYDTYTVKTDWASVKRRMVDSQRSDVRSEDCKNGCFRSCLFFPR